MTQFGLKASLLALAILCGCSRSTDKWEKDRPAVYKTTGQILYQGNPLEGANVFFQSEDQSRTAYATTDKEGRFQLTTFTTGDGAVLGRHVVTASKIVIETDQPANVADNVEVKVTRKVLLPEKYGDAKSSGLTAEVTEKGPNTFVFELTGP